MNFVFIRAFLVLQVDGLQVKDLCLIEEGSMKTINLLVFIKVERLARGRHGFSQDRLFFINTGRKHVAVKQCLIAFSDCKITAR